MTNSQAGGMKIWIDGFEANVPQRLGSSQVAFELLKNLEQIDKKNDYKILLASPPLEDLPRERSGWEYEILKIKRFKTWVAIPYSLFFTKDRPDVFFSPTHYGPLFSPVKRVISIFDLSFLKFPEMFKPRDLYQLKLWTKISVQRADHVVTISESTKKDIEKYYLKSSKKITVSYPGFDSELFHPIEDKKKTEEILEKYKISSPYIIYIGTIQPRKNLVRLIEAFSKLSANGHQLADKGINSDILKLVIVGKTKGLGRQGWMFEDTLNAPKKFGIEDRVIFTGFVPSQDLPYLLNGAIAYCLPSLFEGFGIPALEAMACSTPVIVSNVSSLPEVVGEAGIMVDPYSVEEISSAIKKIYQDKSLREKLSKKSLNQSKNFSWEKMAREVLTVLESVGGE